MSSERLVSRPKKGRLPKLAGLVGGVVGVGLVGLLDWANGTEVSFSVVNLLPIGLTTWYAGRVAGVVVSGVAAAVWLMLDLQSGVFYSDPFIHFWNALVRFGFFLLTTLLLGRLRLLTGNLGMLVKERTAALASEVARSQQAEQAARESGERFRQLAENIKEVFWITDPAKNRMIYISPGYEEIWGRTCASLYGSPRNWVEAIHPDDRERVLAAALTQQTSGQYDVVYRIVRPDGATRWIHDRAFPVRDESGTVGRIVGLAEDITTQKQAEDQLAMLAHAVESTDEPICITDLEDRFTFVNRAFEQVYGYTETDMLGRTPDAVYSPKNPPGLLAEILAQTRLGGWRGEVVGRRKDGTEVPTCVSTSRIESKTGEVIGLMAVAQDITERKKAEKRSAIFGSLGHKLGAVAEPESAGRIIMDMASKLFGWEAGYVHFHSAAEDRIIPILTVDTVNGQRMPVPETSFTLDPSPLMRLVMSEGAQLINRMPDAPPAVPFTPFGDTGRRSASMMYVPIHSSGTVLGVLSIQSYTPHAYSQDDLKLLQALADHCGNALRRIRVGEALRESEERFRTLFESSPLGIAVHGPNGRIVETNSAYQRLTGYTAEELRQLGVKRITHPDDVAEGRRLFDEICEGKRDGYQREKRYRRKDSNVIWGQSTVAALRDDAGRLRLIISIVEDITERRQAVEALRQLAAIVENSNDAIISMTPDGRIVSWNKAAERMFGYRAEEMRDQSVGLLVPSDRAAEQTKVFRTLTAGNTVESFETVRRRKDGSRVHVLMTASAMRDAGGNITGLSAIMHDFTERKRLEKEVVEISAGERRRLGDDLHDGLGQFLAGIAFRAKALEQSLVSAGLPHCNDAKEVAALLGKAIAQTRRLARGLDPIGIEGIGLVAALQVLAAETETVFKLACRFHCADPVLRLTTLRVDPPAALALYRIVQEAVHNAITHGAARQIAMELAMDTDHLCLQIKDDGTGFEVEASNKTGMGLRVMQYRARSIGADLRIKSRPNHGTEISCRVPRAVCFPVADTGPRT